MSTKAVVINLLGHPVLTLLFLFPIVRESGYHHHQAVQCDRKEQCFFVPHDKQSWMALSLSLSLFFGKFSRTDRLSKSSSLLSPHCRRARRFLVQKLLTLAPPRGSPSSTSLIRVYRVILTPWVCRIGQWIFDFSDWKARYMCMYITLVASSSTSSSSCSLCSER